MAQEDIGEQKAWLAKDKATVADASTSKPAISAEEKLQKGYHGGLVTEKRHRSHDSRSQSTWKSIGEIDESQSLTTSVSSNGGSIEVSLVKAIDWS